MKLLEAQTIHPLVEQWLTENGYSFKHEVTMPEYGRADFVARKAPNEILIVECKAELGRDVGRDMAQVLDYCRQYGLGAKPALAAPEKYITDYVRKVCDYYNALLISIDDNGEAAFHYQQLKLKHIYHRSYTQLWKRYNQRKDEKKRKKIKFVELHYRALYLTYDFIRDFAALLLRRGWENEAAKNLILQEVKEPYWSRYDVDVIAEFINSYLFLPISIEYIWQLRGVFAQEDILNLLDQIHEIAIGRKVAITDLQVADVERKLLENLDIVEIRLIQFTKIIAALLHNHRESFGKPELAEDIDDVRPIIDAARPEIQRVFSQKPRRLPDANHPQLPDR